MPTIAEVVKDYLENQKNKTDQFTEVIIRCEGTDYKFEHVTEFKNLTNFQFNPINTFRIKHYSMIFGDITDMETEISGKIISQTKKTGERKYQGN